MNGPVGTFARPERPGMPGRLAARMRRASLGRLRVLALALIAFLILSQTGLHPFREVRVSLQRSEGELDKQIVLLGLGLTVLLVAWDRRRLLNNISLPWPLLILLAYCALSITWAIDPEIALRRFALTGFATWFIAREFQALGYARSLYVMRLGFCLLLAINFLAVIFLPEAVHTFELGDDPGIEGNWKGALVHKNSAGAVCALTIILCLYGWQSMGRAFSLIALGGAALFLYFTHSKTSEAALVMALLVGWATSHFGGRPVTTRLFLLVMLVIFGFQGLLFYQHSIIEVFTDPYGFTGRAAIWSLLLEYARRHLWYGSGFGSFWQIGNRSPIWDLTNGWVAQLASSGHNGYLDLLVSIGLPGLLLAVSVLLILPIYRLWTSPRMPAAKRGLLASLVTFAMLHNFGESTLLERTSPIYLLLIFSLMAIEEDRGARGSLLARLGQWRLPTKRPEQGRPGQARPGLRGRRG